MSAPDASEYAATSALLAAHLDPIRFGNPRFLDWFYGANPRGRALVEDIDNDQGQRIAHYGVLPTMYRTPAGPTPFVFSSNVATDPNARRKGLFREMADRIYPRVAATGVPGMVGSGNAASSVIVVERFGWGSLGPMPVAVCVPTTLPRGIRDIEVNAAFLAGDELDRVAADLDWVPVHDWVQSWTVDFLRWRLANPNAKYTLHIGPDALAVSTREHGPLGIPAAVLCKIFPRPGARLPIRTRPYIAAACRAQRAPVCIYAGWNAHARVRGIPLPVRLRPSPLVIVFRSFDEVRAPTEQFRLDTFEFLDSDTY